MPRWLLILLVGLAGAVVLFFAMNTAAASAATRRGAERFLISSNFGGWCGHGLFTVCIPQSRHANCYRGLGRGWWRCDGEFSETGARRRRCHFEGATNGRTVSRIIAGPYTSYCYSAT